MNSDLTLLPSWIDGTQRTLVGVCPPSAFHQRHRLLHALERVLPVQFTPRAHAQWRELQAAIVFTANDDLTEQPKPARLPTLIVEDQRTAADRRVRPIRTADVDRLDARLRGRRMESLVNGSVLQRAPAEGVVLISAGDVPLWQTSSGVPRVDRLAVAPAELEPDESLRDHMRDGRYLELLPLYEFLRSLTGYKRPDAEIRATFVIDDPNLHWRSYSFIRFDRLAEHARAHGYHVTFATVPLDCWFAWPAAARTFRANTDVLSLTSHGARHDYAELSARRSSEDASRLFKDAAARMDRFADRWHVPISRVMVPPHGLSALPAHEPLLTARFEALCTGLGWWSDWPETHRPVAGIAMADVSPTGLPVFPRHSVEHRFLREEAVISGYLDQPVVLYGHAGDISSGYDRFAEMVAWLRRAGPTTWLALEEIARTNVVTHFDAPTATLHLQVLARHSRITAPAGAHRVSVEGSGPARDVGWVRSVGAMLPVQPTPGGWRAEGPCEGGQPIEVIIGEMFSDRTYQRPAAAPLRAYLRRAAVESRDRLRPSLRRLKLEPAIGAVEAAFHSARSRMHAR